MWTNRRTENTHNCIIRLGYRLGLGRVMSGINVRHLPFFVFVFQLGRKIQFILTSWLVKFFVVEKQRFLPDY